MTLDRIFIGYSIVLGLAIGTVYVMVPASRTIGLSPYLWALIGVGAFDLIAAYLRGFDKGSPITMQSRVIGFIVAVGLLVVIRLAAGVE